MTKPEAIDYGLTVDAMKSNTGRKLFQPVSFEWSSLRRWRRNEQAPIGKAEKRQGFLYAITWHAARSKLRDRIVYIGLASNPQARFADYKGAADSLAQQGATVNLSVGKPAFGRHRATIINDKTALEELEHIFIWTTWHHLMNKKKIQTVPGQGVNGGRAWYITNSGFTFAGQMPEEIVYPWLRIKHHDRRRSRAPKQTSSPG